MHFRFYGHINGDGELMANKNSFFSRPGVRVGLVISMLMAFLAGVVLFVLLATRSMFSRNSHFVIEKVEVVSPGWWKGKDEEVCRILGIVKGHTNLFSVKLPDLKKTMENQASIEHASVRRILPDVISIHVSERIPRAFLYKKNSPYVVDGDGIVMSRENCLNLRKDLPYITGINSGVKNGSSIPDLQPAVELIELSHSKYPDIRFYRLGLEEYGEIKAVLYYKKDFFEVVFPREELDQKMKLLEIVLDSIINSGGSRRRISMIFNAKIPVSP